MSAAENDGITANNITVKGITANSAAVNGAAVNDVAANVVSRAKDYVRRCPHGSDPGVGTMAGVALVMAAAVLLSILAMVGNVFIWRARAVAAADLAALSAATVLWESSADPCGTAQTVARSHKGNLESCKVDGDIVAVGVSVRTAVPLIPRVTSSARAGPIECS